MCTRFFLYIAVFQLFFLRIHAQEKTPMQPLDLFDLEYISDPQISPRGDMIAYVRNFKDIMTDRDYSNIWLCNADGSMNRPLTQGNLRNSSPRWSNDGSAIAYLSNEQDNRTKLMLYSFDTRESVALTNSVNPPGAVSWSPDDKTLAFTAFVPSSKKNLLKIPSKPEGAQWNDGPIYIDEMNYRGDGAGYFKPGNRQIFVLDRDGGTAAQLTSSDNNHGSPIWSGDGKSLIFSANLHENHDLEPRNSEIYQIEIADGSIKALTSRMGPDSDPVLSPDGKRIAYTGLDDKYQGYQTTELYVMNADGSGSRLLSKSFEYDVSNPQWSADGRGIYFQYNQHGDIKVAIADLDGNIRNLFGGVGGLDLGRPYIGGDFSVSSSGRFAYTLKSPDRPSDLAVFANGISSQLTHINDDLFSFRKIGKTEEIWWKSSYDGMDVQGWIVTPPDFDPSKKYPLILEIHGGPFAMYGPSFAYEIHQYAASGYVVLFCNPRGSTGYGPAFGNAIHHDYPNHDYDDLMSGVDAVIAKGYIDTSNLFVTGGSGGGVLTAWIVGKTTRFKAAVVAKPVINWVSHSLYADNPAFFTKYWFPGKPWEAIENYMRRSPLSLVGNVKTPTMLLTGEEDYRTPMGESEQYYAALKLQEVETALVKIPNASHGLVNRPSMLITKSAAILSWFEHYRNRK